MITRAERKRYYTRCVLAADRTGVPVSKVQAHLRQYLHVLGTHPCATRGCENSVPDAHGKRYCSECLRERKRTRDLERWHAQRKQHVVLTHPDFVAINVPVQCADCGNYDETGGTLHLESLTVFCHPCTYEIVSIRGEKGTKWDI